MDVLKVPETCAKCSSILCIDSSTYICNMESLLNFDKEIDISSIEVNPDEQPPEWCPYVNANRKINNLDAKKRQAAENFISGLKVLFDFPEE